MIGIGAILLILAICMFIKCKKARNYEENFGSDANQTSGYDMINKTKDDSTLHPADKTNKYN